jgi:hypothetical protein
VSGGAHLFADCKIRPTLFHNLKAIAQCRATAR